MLAGDDSRRDELTGLANRRAFDEAFGLEVERSRRLGGQFGLVMVDIDDFKAISDARGHQQGDVVLREVARVLRASCRKIDLPARYGGEEFAVVLPGRCRSPPWTEAPTSTTPTRWPSACAPRSRAPAAGQGQLWRGLAARGRRWPGRWWRSGTAPPRAQSGGWRGGLGPPGPARRGRRPEAAPLSLVVLPAPLPVSRCAVITSAGTDARSIGRDPGQPPTRRCRPSFSR
ncbi:MAG: diguanylate cyclase [Actinomycetota bacterium]|nr:diguanylate cyclase [Actinomycetota bacterium]